MESQPQILNSGLILKTFTHIPIIQKKLQISAILTLTATSVFPMQYSTCFSRSDHISLDTGKQK